MRRSAASEPTPSSSTPGSNTASVMRIATTAPMERARLSARHHDAGRSNQRTVQRRATATAAKEKPWLKIES